MTVSFHQRGSTIQARLTDGKSVSLRLSTGIKVPSHIKFANGRFAGNTPDVAVMNNDLDRQKVKLTDLYIHCKGDIHSVKKHYGIEPDIEEDNTESYDLVKMMREYLRRASSGQIKSKFNRPLSLSTIATYANAANTLADYVKIRGSLDLMEMNIDPRDSVQKKRDITDRWNRYFDGFDNYMLDLGFKISTRFTYMLNVSIIINYWKEHLYFQLPKIKLYAPEHNQIVVLEPEFVQHFLTNDKIYNTMSDTMKYVWEVSATILITTMRFDDVINLSVEDFHISKNGMFLSKMNGKTREYTDVPIPKQLERVYRDNLVKYGRVYTLGKEAQHLISRKIKELFAMYPDMHHPVTIKKIGIRGEDVTEVKPMYQHVHPHMLRKTAITTMMYYKVSERHIKFCSGHSANSEAFERYVAFVDRHFKSEVKDYYKNFLGE